MNRVPWLGLHYNFAFIVFQHFYNSVLRKVEQGFVIPTGQRTKGEGICLRPHD